MLGDFTYAGPMDGPRTLIANIDRKLNAVRLKLMRLEPVNVVGWRNERRASARWQLAWDRHPDLKARNDALNQQRIAAMEARDARDSRLHAAAERAERARLRSEARVRASALRCSACGQSLPVPVPA